MFMFTTAALTVVASRHKEPTVPNRIILFVRVESCYLFDASLIMSHSLSLPSASLSPPSSHTFNLREMGWHWRLQMRECWLFELLLK